MAKKLKILALVGSIRRESFNKKLALAAKKYASGQMDVEIYIPDNLPLFTQDLEKDPPQEIKDLKRKIENSDAILFVTPEHNFTLTAVLKNAIEWGNRPWGDNSFMNKPAAIMGVASGRFSTVRVQNHLRQVFVDLSVITFLWPQLMVGNAKDKFDEKGELIDKESIRRLKDFMKHFAHFVKTLPKDPELFTTAKD